MIADFLPGKISIERGSARDYEALARFHYVAGRPGTWAGVWVARYSEIESLRQSRAVPARSGATRPGSEFLRKCDAAISRVVAIAVLSWPPLGSKGREEVMHLNRLDIKKRAKWLNENVRSISRVVVHPQFRGVGLASELVRRILCECPTRYVETIAAMGKVHPFFEKAGMKRVEHEGEKAYFIFDREEKTRNSKPEIRNQSGIPNSELQTTAPV